MKKNDFCCFCQKPITNDLMCIKFNYSGLAFRVFTFGLGCADCVIEREIEKFKKFGKFVEIKEDKIFIDWEFFCEKEKCREETYSEIVYNEMKLILLSLGIFSFNSYPNYAIVADGGIFLNPPCSVEGWLYFTREVDAKEYAKIKYSNSHYGWEIRQIKKQS